MNRGELAVTVLGLLGTFLLPWHGERSTGDAQAIGTQSVARQASCATERQDIDAMPAPVRAHRAAASVGRS